MAQPRLRSLSFALFLAASCSPTNNSPVNDGAGGRGTGGTRAGGAGSSQGTGGATNAGTAGGSGGGDTSAGGTGGTSAGTGGTTASNGGSTGDGGAGGRDAAASPNDDAQSAPDGPMGGDAPSGGGGLGAWQYSRTVTLDTTATGANVMADVAHYPVAVILDSTFDFSQAKAGGADVRFSTADGAMLPYAIEQWDATAKHAVIWVKVDVKGNSKSSSLLMNWGNAAATDASNSAAVFDTKDGFVGVWHLSETSSTQAGNYKDATANAANLTGIATASGADGDGRLGRAVSLHSAQKQWVRLDGDKNKTFDLVDHVTYSIWTYANNYAGEYVTAFAKGDNSWRIHMYGSASWGENKNKHIVEMCCETSGGQDECAIHSDPSQGTDVAPQKWFHWVAVLDHPKLTLYLNGVQEITTNSGGAWKSDATYPVGIGNNSQIPTRFWDGLLDEARVMNVSKDANWAKLEFESQREGQKFLTLGAAQKRF